MQEGVVIFPILTKKINKGIKSNNKFTHVVDFLIGTIVRFEIFAQIAIYDVCVKNDCKCSWSQTHPIVFSGPQRRGKKSKSATSIVSDYSSQKIVSITLLSHYLPLFLFLLPRHTFNDAVSLIPISVRLCTSSRSFRIISRVSCLEEQQKKIEVKMHLFLSFAANRWIWGRCGLSSLWFHP